MTATPVPLFELPAQPRTVLPSQAKASISDTKNPPHPNPSKQYRFTLQQRDRAVFSAIHHYNGVLSDQQIQGLFFPTKYGAVSFERRAYGWVEAGYIERHLCQLGCMVNFLTRKGAADVASLKGAKFDTFKWRKPGERWLEVPHDVRSNDFAIAVERAVAALPSVTILESISDYEFRRFPDQVILAGRKGGKFKYNIYPDWFYQLLATHPATGHENRLRYLLETDMHEHSGIAFVERKVKPYGIYFDSPQYRARFGTNHGQCLIMTTDSHWVTILKERTESSGLSTIGRFYFASHEAVVTHPILTDPIWQQAGKAGYTALLATGHTKAS